MRTAPLLPALWNGLSRLQEVGPLFGDWQEGTPWSFAPASTHPAMNVWEDEEAFRVEVELPGVPQDRVQVTVEEQHRLTVEGERPAEEYQGAWHRRERRFGAFRRVLALPAPVDPDKVEARLEHGVLYLTLPKAEEARPRRVPVRGA
jgi:HSP20 family protein